VDQLNKKTGITLSVGLKLTALGYADDLALLSHTHFDMQKLLDFSAEYSKANNYNFSAGKCKTLVLHKNYNSLKPLYLNGVSLDYVDSYTYLGVCYHKSRLSFKTYFDKLIKRAVQRGAGIRQIGYSVNGLRPKSGLKLYSSLIRPIFEYASQVLNPPKSFINGSRACQTQNIKLLLGLERGTSNACVRLLSGLPPIIARLDFLKLKHYLRKLNQDSKSKLLNHILSFPRDGINFGFTHSVQIVFKKYNIPFINQMSDAWEDQAKSIKKTIYSYWFKKDMHSLSKCSSRGRVFVSLFKTSTSYYKHKYTPLDLVTRVLENCNREHRAAYFKFLSGYCFLFNYPCSKCGYSTPNISHFLLNCSFYTSERNIYFHKVRKLLYHHLPKILSLFNSTLTSHPTIATHILFGANLIISQDVNNPVVIRFAPKNTFYTASDNIPLLTAKFANHIISSHNT